MKIALTTLALVAYAQAIKISSEQGDAAQRFANWASKHNRNYNSKSQRDMRFGEWLIKDRSYNSINEDKQNTFTVGHNNMSDWTDAEFQSILLQNPKVVSLPEQSFAEILADQKGGKGGGETTCSCSKCGSSCGTCYDYGKINQTQTSFDHRPADHATSWPIKDQLYCGSCWAFADAAVLELQNYLRDTAVPIQQLSEQHIVDCNPWRWGCNGGWPDDIFTGWLVPQSVALTYQSDYPYTSGNGYWDSTGASCAAGQYTASNFKATSLTKWQYQLGARAQQIISALETRGPYITYLRADTAYFQGYSSGILNNTCCQGSSPFLTLNHAIATVGWGIVDVNGVKSSYWLMRNSWGTSWGDQGYIRMTIMTTGAGVCGDQYYGDTITVAQL